MSIFEEKQNMSVVDDMKIVEIKIFNRKENIYMDNEKKETAIQNEQQLNKNEVVVKELQELNKSLKEISDTLMYISTYGINARIS